MWLTGEAGKFLARVSYINLCRHRYSEKLPCVFVSMIWICFLTIMNMFVNQCNFVSSYDESIVFDREDSPTKGPLRNLNSTVLI